MVRWNLSRPEAIMAAVQGIPATCSLDRGWDADCLVILPVVYVREFEKHTQQVSTYDRQDNIEISIDWAAYQCVGVRDSLCASISARRIGSGILKCMHRFTTAQAVSREIRFPTDT